MIVVLVDSVLVIPHIVLTINVYWLRAFGTVLSILQMPLFEMIECMDAATKFTTTQFNWALCFVRESPLNGQLIITIIQYNYVIELVNLLDNAAAP